MTFFFAAICLYIAVFSLLHFSLFFGLLFERAREKRLVKNTTGCENALVSIIVPVRNEEEALPRLIESLKAQRRPNLEYIFINDGSTDGTAALLDAFKAQSASNVVIVNIEENAALSDTSFYNRKQKALTKGIAAAHGEILLFTDADCEAHPDWAGYMSKIVSAEKTGIALGPVYKKPREKNGTKQKWTEAFLADYQCFDHLVRGMYVAGAAGLGAPGGGFGNNIAVRRGAMELIGGYENLPASITEDAALISSVRKKTGFNVRAVYAPESHIFTRREPDWKRLINQTLRWHYGGLFSSDPVTALSFGALALLFLLCFLAFPLALLHPAFLLIPLTVFLEVFLGNLPAKIYAGKSFPSGIAEFMLLSFFIEYFFTLLTVLSLTGKKPDWKR